MSNEIKSISNNSEDKKTTYSVEKIENGFLVTENCEWQSKDGYKYETKKYFSDVNPFDEEIMDRFEIIKNALK